MHRHFRRDARTRTSRGPAPHHTIQRCGRVRRRTDGQRCTSTRDRRPDNTRTRSFSRHHLSESVDGAVGRSLRPAPRSWHWLAGHSHRRNVLDVERTRHQPGTKSVGDKTCVPVRRARRHSPTGQSRRNPIRHRRHVDRVETVRRHHSRHRCIQCRCHRAVRHSSDPGRRVE